MSDLVVQHHGGLAIPADEQSLGAAAGDYLVFKRKRLTPASQRAYRQLLSEFITAYPTARVSDFEPPRGTALIEDFLTARYSHLSGRTYNKALSVLSDFFGRLHDRGEINRDPTPLIERAKARPFHRTTFSDDEREAILAANPEPRDQIALRLLLDYALRKGALMNVRFEHFDWDRRMITIFTKGEKILTIPIPDPMIWANLETLDEPGDHYLLPKQHIRRRTAPHRQELELVDVLLGAARSQLDVAAADLHIERELGALVAAVDRSRMLLELTTQTATHRTERWLEEKIGEHGTHDWWYRCLGRAGVVEPGTTSGRRLHSARHTAGQRVLNKTGNLKAAQTLLGHATIGTTGDLYVGWELEQLDETLRSVIPGLVSK